MTRSSGRSALAALRVEATETYNRLMSTGAGLSDPAVGPLKEYIASLSGGECAECAVTFLDTEAEERPRRPSAIFT